MGNRGFNVLIPYTIKVNNKLWDMSIPLKKYLKSPQVTELSQTNMFPIENENIVWNATVADPGELVKKYGQVDPRDVLCTGSIEILDGSVIYKSSTIATEYDIDLNTVRFALPLIDESATKLFYHNNDMDDSYIQEELNKKTILCVHIVAALKYPAR